MLTTKALGEGMSAIQRKITKHDNEKSTGKTVAIHHVSILWQLLLFIVHNLSAIIALPQLYDYLKLINNGHCNKFHPCCGRCIQKVPLIYPKIATVHRADRRVLFGPFNFNFPRRYIIVVFIFAKKKK